MTASWSLHQKKFQSWAESGNTFWIPGLGEKESSKNSAFQTGESHYFAKGSHIFSLPFFRMFFLVTFCRILKNGVPHPKPVRKPALRRRQVSEWPNPAWRDCVNPGGGLLSPGESLSPAIFSAEPSRFLLMLQGTPSTSTSIPTVCYQSLVWL